MRVLLGKGASIMGKSTVWVGWSVALGAGVIRSREGHIWTRPRCQGTLEWKTRFGTDCSHISTPSNVLDDYQVMLEGKCCFHNALNTKAIYAESFCNSITCVAQCISVCSASNLAEARGILFSSAGLI